MIYFYILMYFYQTTLVLSRYRLKLDVGLLFRLFFQVSMRRKYPLNNLVLFAKSLQIKRFDNYKADQ